MMGLGNLIDPEGLGGFKVCIQAKGVGAGGCPGSVARASSSMIAYQCPS